MTTHPIALATGVWQDDDLPTSDELGADPGHDVDGDNREPAAAPHDQPFPPGAFQPSMNVPANDQALAWWKRHGLDKLGRVSAADVIAARDRDHAEALGVPLPQRVPGAALARRDRIDQIHRLAAWFEQHPDVPVPWTVNANVEVYDVLKLEQLAEQLGASIYGPDARPQFTHTLYRAYNVAGPDMQVQVTVHVTQPDKPL